VLRALAAAQSGDPRQPRTGTTVPYGAVEIRDRSGCSTDLDRRCGWYCRHCSALHDERSTARVPGGAAMTTMCDRFFGIPQSAVRLGKLKTLCPVAVNLYIALWHESERYSTRELIRSTKELIELVGGSRNSHAKARTELIDAGLVVVEPFGTAGFVFHLCDPETGKPWSLPPNKKVLYQKKNAPRSASDQDIPDAVLQKASSPPKTPSLPKTAPPSKTPPLSEAPPLASTPAECDIEFSFGFNCAEQKVALPTKRDAPIRRDFVDYSPFKEDKNEFDE
jgi:hypothetical protein